jgi:hypothetical protein
MSDFRYAKTRFRAVLHNPLARRTNAEFMQKVFSEIYAILQEDIEFDPINYRFLASEVLDCPFIGMNQRLEILEKLHEMGISPMSKHHSQVVQLAMVHHRDQVIGRLQELDVVFHPLTFLPLMTSDAHLEFLQMVWHLIYLDTQTMRKFLSTIVECGAWKILDFILVQDGLPEVSSLTTPREVNNGILFHLLKAGDEIFLKYHKRLRTKFHISDREEIKAMLSHCVESNLEKAFGELFSVVPGAELTAYFIGGVINKIIEKKNERLLSFIPGNSPIVFNMIGKIIKAEWFIGLKTLIETSRINTLSLVYDRNIGRWFSMSYKRRKPEILQMYEYLKCVFPGLHEAWRQEKMLNHQANAALNAAIAGGAGPAVNPPGAWEDEPDEIEED